MTNALTDTSVPDRPPALDPVPRPPRRWYRRPGGIGAAVVVAGSFALWAYAFSGAAKKDPPDTLHDAAFGQTAEAMCAPVKADIDALPPAPAAHDPQERAATLYQANELLAAQLAELRTPPRGDAFDTGIIDQWLADWDQYLIDRTQYADILATGTDAKFVITARDGEDYTKSMDNFAKVNDMPSCATPGDV